MLAVLGLALLLAAPGPVELLASKDVEDRLQAVKLLDEKGGDDAEALLLGVLDDSDWEVMHRAAEALAKRGAEASVIPLAKLAVDGPTARIRLVAAESLKAIDREEGALLISKRLKSATYFAATRALAVLGHTAGAKQVERMLKNKDPEKRVAAVRALAAERNVDRIPLWTKMLTDPDVRVHVEAIQALVLTRDQYALRPLVDALKEPNLSQVLQRRYIRAVLQLAAGLKDEAQRARAGEACIAAFGSSSSGEVNARYARLIGLMGAKGQAIGPVDQYVDRLATTGLSHSSFHKPFPE